MIPFPNKKYKIIYADPPWEYEDKLNHHGGSAQSHYDVMKFEDICDLPINEITDENCFLFLWGTWPLLLESIQLINSWGFEYKTIGFVWIKSYHTGKDVFGMGNYTRGNTEFCLIGIKGKPKRLANNVSQLIKTTIRHHSKKPDLVRDKIIHLCGDLPRIELFARTKIHGWDVWGNDSKLQNEPLEVFFET